MPRVETEAARALKARLQKVKIELPIRRDEARRRQHEADRAHNRVRDLEAQQEQIEQGLWYEEHPEDWPETAQA